MYKFDNEKTVKITLWSDLDSQTKSIIKTKTYKTKGMEHTMLLMPDIVPNDMNWFVLERLCYPFSSLKCKVDNFTWTQDGVAHRVYIIPRTTEEIT